MARTKTIKPTENTLEDITFISSNQSISRRIIYSLNDTHKIKLEVKSDSYKSQCYAKAYLLKDFEWTLIYSIPYALMKTEEGIECRIPYSQKYNEKKVSLYSHKFINDIITLKNKVKEILQ